MIQRQIRVLQQLQSAEVLRIHMKPQQVEDVILQRKPQQQESKRGRRAKTVYALKMGIGYVMFVDAALEMLEIAKPLPKVATILFLFIQR